MIEIVRHTQRKVKRWQDGDTRKRWTAAGMLAAERQSGGSSATDTSPRSPASTISRFCWTVHVWYYFFSLNGIPFG